MKELSILKMMQSGELENAELFPSILYNVRMEQLQSTLPTNQYDFDTLLNSIVVPSWYDELNEIITPSWKEQLQFDEEFQPGEYEIQKQLHGVKSKPKSKTLKTVILKLKGHSIVKRTPLKTVSVKLKGH